MMDNAADEKAKTALREKYDTAVITCKKAFSLALSSALIASLGQRPGGALDEAHPFDTWKALHARFEVTNLFDSLRRRLELVETRLHTLTSRPQL
jgi:hypothetical protein